jgi:hypothetical protein
MLVLKEACLSKGEYSYWVPWDEWYRFLVDNHGRNPGALLQFMLFVEDQTNESNAANYLCRNYFIEEHGL